MPQQYVARWTGGRIGSGATILHFESIGSGTAAQSIATATRALFASLATYLPNDVAVTFDAEVLEISNSGVLLGSYSVTPGAAVTGSGTGSWANGSGALVRHNTGSIIGGKRIYGRTFLVPMIGAAFENNGEVTAGAITAIGTAFSTFRSSVSGVGANHAVWSRVNAATVPVASSVCLPRPTVLGTRNDRV